MPPRPLVRSLPAGSSELPYPRPTSRDIITTKPSTEVQEASFPLPLRGKNEGVSSRGACRVGKAQLGASSGKGRDLPEPSVPPRAHLVCASGMISSITT